MKTNIRYIAIILLFFGACKKDHGSKSLVQPLTDGSLPSGAISSAQIVSNSGSQLTIALDIYIFRDSKNLENQLEAANFLSDTTSNYYFTLQEENFINGNSAKPYSALLLMDQSGSISSTDPNNYRISAADSFCTHLGQGDNVMLWSFSGAYNNKTLEYYGTGFSSDGNAVLPYIESLKGQTGGGTPLYLSQDSVINYCAANATSANKAVMTFTDGENTESGSADDVISRATAQNVKLYNIGLSSAEVEVLSKEAFLTGGAFMFAKDAPQLISMFGNLGKLLDETGQYYHTVWNLNKISGTFSSGTLTQTVKIQLPYGGEIIEVPFSLDY